MQIQKKNITKMYSIVSAVYNVAPYLNDYFKSIVNQSLGFSKYIQLILVDDGSTDNSADIIQTWQKKYPDNIKYIKQNNAGQASARNLGIDYVETAWVTFIDPDDFVHKHYFKEIHHCIESHDNLVVVSCRIKYYFEKYRIYLDRHPLKKCFKEHDTSSTILELNKQIQLSASTAIFKTDRIHALGLKFDTRIKPNFEDAHFVNSYLIENAEDAIFFLKSAIYYYRRRTSKNSTIDTAWHKKELFDDVLRLGCKDLFHHAKQKYGYVPIFVQRAVLYHVAWYYRNLMNHNEQIAFLSQEEQSTFHGLLKALFKDIDLGTIENFDLANISFFEKYAWVKQYKQTPLTYRTVSIVKNRDYLILSYYADKEEDINIQIDNISIAPITTHIKEHSFVNKQFVNEYQIHIPRQAQQRFIDIQLNAEQTYLHSGHLYNKNRLEISKVQSTLWKSGREIFHNMARKLLLG